MALPYMLKHRGFPGRLAGTDFQFTLRRANPKGATEIIHRADLGNQQKIAKHTADYEKRFANPFVAAERGFIDEVIQPRSTRKRISRAFAALRGKRLENPWKKHDNIPL